MKTYAIRRAGFTLIELLTVLAIMGLLAAITISAVARFKQSSNEKFTNIQLRKAQIALEQQYKGAVDAIKKETPPTALVELTKHANGQKDMSRARALYMKLRLRQEFPQTYAEVDQTLWNAEFRPALIALAAVDPMGTMAAQFQPKRQFQLALGVAPADQDIQSGVLLTLILTQSRAGSNFDIESVGRVRPETSIDKAPRVIIDYFDRPICFRRWTDNDDPAGIAAELSDPPNAQPTPATTPAGYRFNDPEDPDGRLSPAYSNDWLPGAYQAAVNLFIPKSAGVRPAFNATTTHPFDGKHRGPYTFSAGMDQMPGTDDDLLSFRIQQAGKGN